MPRNASKRTLTVDVGLRPSPGVETPPARIYLFDRGGALIDSKPVGGRQVTFELVDDYRHRVVVGPDIPPGDQSPADLVDQLGRAGAISRDVGPGIGLNVELQVPAHIYGCWWQTCILVHGSVRKETAPGVYAPICDGVVQIFQVDLGCTLDRLASFTDAPLWYKLLIDALHGLDREVLRERIGLIPNLPDPPPDGSHQTNVLHATTLKERRAVTQTASVAALTAASSAQVEAGRASSLSELAATMRALPQSALKDAVLANKAIIGPFLCWLIPDDWFCWQELGEATIQSDGTFSAQVCFWCPDDFPDLYFEVVQTVGGIEREISDPQIACSTYYDYDGSQDVVITVTDPAAVACNDPGSRPIPGDDYYVWPTAIGNTDLRGIAGLEDPAGSMGQGLVAGAPWGGTLALQMEFDPRLKADGVAQYYRWSYKFDGAPDWTPINAPVTHRYKTVTYAPLEIHLHQVNLGPTSLGPGKDNLFEVPDPYPGDGWVNISDPSDRPFAYFDSTDNHLSPFTYNDTLPRKSGMCTLLLEIFDSSGNLVPCGNNGVGGPFVFVLPDYGQPPGNYTSVLGANNITAAGQLVFRVLVDNNDTYANVDEVTAGGNVADACGILHYTSGSDIVAISFHATHPNNYVTWTLEVWRGSSGEIDSISGSGSESPVALSDPWDHTASVLLGGCSSAAFAADLWTYATATDGYGTQTQYNRFYSLAFALLAPCPDLRQLELAQAGSQLG
jgi:hypothetical protein